MKIAIIIAYIPRYERGHEVNFVPPITGIHLAALTPKHHQVQVIHQQLNNIDLDLDADLVAISFFSGFAPAAYSIAAGFRQRGKTVIAGGPHVTFCAQESLQYFDSVVTGEADAVWSKLLEDFEQGQLQEIYHGSPCDMLDLPTPRYDLLKRQFFIPRVIQATRGCPFKCSFCTVPTLNPGFRLRPVADVIRDIQYNDFPHWWQRKIVWFWDDNLTINRKYIKELLTAMIPLKKWWLTQASLDIAKDEELLDLMQQSGCIGIFFGIETFEKDSLADANKKQNKIEQYKKSVAALHKRGICVMSGFISGFDSDTPEKIVQMADRLMEVGINVPFLSILTPFKGTPLYTQLATENRIIEERGWEYYNGYNVAFDPKLMDAETLLKSHRKLWKKAFSFRYSLTRIFRSLFTLRFGALCMSVCMNSFYLFKQLTRNYPVDAGKMKLPKPEGLPVEVFKNAS